MDFSVFSVASFRHDGFRMESKENIRLENNSGRIVNESANTNKTIKYLPIAVVSPDFGFLMQSGERIALESGFRLLEEDLGQMLDENGRLLWMNDNQSITLEGDWARRQLFTTKQIVTFLLEDETGNLGNLLLETNKPYLYED